ncbi:DUF2023 family protein [Candidatus Acetothermia bacterium]|nr:DUF2023 family protein [Candidatus Acetothermia bacterium]
MDRETENNAMCSSAQRIFAHNLYEYKKGLRNLVLYTTSSKEQLGIEATLKRLDVAYYIQKVNQTKINIFFGEPQCVEMIRSIGCRSLTELTAEEDFILGIMLGYDRLRQCERYLQRKKNDTNLPGTQG